MSVFGLPFGAGWIHCRLIAVSASADFADMASAFIYDDASFKSGFATEMFAGATISAWSGYWAHVHRCLLISLCPISHCLQIERYVLFYKWEKLFVGFYVCFNFWIAYLLRENRLSLMGLYQSFAHKFVDLFDIINQLLLLRRKVFVRNSVAQNSCLKTVVTAIATANF